MTWQSATLISFFARRMRDPRFSIALCFINIALIKALAMRDQLPVYKMMIFIYFHQHRPDEKIGHA
jgi:hypothetical protein